MITGVVDFAMGFVFACYILAQKERLAEQVRRLGQAVFSERQYIRAEVIWGRLHMMTVERFFMSTINIC